MNTSPMAAVLIVPIRWYQRYISRYTPPSCRYYPCCSNYAIDALRQHGALIGTALTIWRLLRCNPWSSGGVDHVPPRGALRLHRATSDDVRPDSGERPATTASSQPGPSSGPANLTQLDSQPVPASEPITGRTAA